MTVRIEKSGPVWIVIHSRPDGRNAMDPVSAYALVAAFQFFDADSTADVGVLWGEGGAFCAGWHLKYASSLKGDKPLASLDFPTDGGKPPRGPLGPTRLELSKPVIAAVEGPARRGHGTGAMVRSARHGGECLPRRVLPAVGHSAPGWRDRAPAAVGRSGARARNHSHGP